MLTAANVRCQSAAECPALRTQRLQTEGKVIVQYIKHMIVAGCHDWDEFQQRWRTHRCRVMSGTTSRPLRQKRTRSQRIFSTPAILRSKLSTSLLQSLVSSATRLSSLFSCSLSRSPTRYRCRLQNNVALRVK